jgi:hypothetical protein
METYEYTPSTKKDGIKKSENKSSEFIENLRNYLKDQPKPSRQHMINLGLTIATVFAVISFFIGPIVVESALTPDPSYTQHGVLPDAILNIWSTVIPNIWSIIVAIFPIVFAIWIAISFIRTEPDLEI